MVDMKKILRFRGFAKIPNNPTPPPHPFFLKLIIIKYYHQNHQIMVFHFSIFYPKLPWTTHPLSNVIWMFEICLTSQHPLWLNQPGFWISGRLRRDRLYVTVCYGVLNSKLTVSDSAKRKRALNIAWMSCQRLREWPSIETTFHHHLSPVRAND